jgi:dTDP-4-dehydrorhamnose reductase
MLLVAGAGGFLGHHLAQAAFTAGKKLTLVARRDISSRLPVTTVNADLSDPVAVNDLLLTVKASCVINCAAFTDVDRCEREPALAHQGNVKIPATLAAACAASGSHLVHISTDSVFDGARGDYTESDVPSPVNAYARSKLEGERAVMQAMPHALILRTNFIGPSVSGKSGLADWIAGAVSQGQPIRGFTDVIFSPLFVNDLAQVILTSIDAGLSGIYHASARDSISKYDFAVRLARSIGGDETLVSPATIDDATFAAPRPRNTSLSPAKLSAALGREMPSVDDTIGAYAALHAVPSKETTFLR